MTTTLLSEPVARPPARPAPRPENIWRPWDVRWTNAFVGLIERTGLYKVGVSPDQLLNEARRDTGLEFADKHFEEPLRVLTTSIMNEADLHPCGRFMMFLTCKNFLKNRLGLEHAWRTRPETLSSPVRQPLYVIGLPRTGTTLLYNLLCQDPAARPLQGWESFFPAAVPNRRGRVIDRRQAEAQKIVNKLHRMAPRLRSVHEIVSAGPEECTWLLHNTFLATSFLLQARLPSYAEYVKNQSRETWRHVYTEYANTLKLLQHGSPATHWVLKSPAHQLGLAGLLDVIPNACIVQTHREPKKVIGSCCSLFSVVRTIYSDRVDPTQLGPEILDNLAVASERAMSARDERPDQVFDVRFEELVQDPIGTVRRIYDRFGYPFDPRMETGMRNWLAENPQGKHGAHKYDVSEFGLTDEQVQSTFADYQARYESASRK